MSTCSVLPALLVLLAFIAPSARGFLPHASSRALLHDDHGGNLGVRRATSGVSMSSAKPSSAAAKLRDLLSGPEILIMPCCYDG